MSEKKYQIFVSSTYVDLKDTRSKVIDTILNSYHFPVGMEFFSAGDAQQWEIIKELIDESDYYIVILGHRYGSATDEGISYTEKEYDYAVERGIPVLAFIRDRNVATLATEREATASNTKKLNNFITKAQANKVCDFWSTDDELATKVAIALPKMFHRTPRTGWVRGNTAMTPEVANEIAASSRENRSLRDEIDSLKKNLSVKEPILSLVVDGDWTFTLGSYESIAKPEPLSLSDIPAYLEDSVSESDINEYNSKIPTDEKVQEYDFVRRVSQSATKNAYLPVFEVINSGSAKANGIVISVEFPPILGVLSEQDFDKFKEVGDTILISPIDTAEKEYQEQLRKKKSSIFSAGVRDLSITNMFHPPVMSSINDIKLNNSHVSERTVSIELNGLMHTQSKKIDEGVRVFPIEAGTGEVTIRIICEELGTPVILTMPVKVE